MKSSLFVVTEDHHHLFLMGLDRHGCLVSKQFIGCLAAKIQVSRFDFYLVFMPNNAYIVRAYRNGDATGKSAQFFTDSWEPVVKRFPLLLPYAKDLQHITDEIWVSHDNVCRLKPIMSSIALMTN